MPWVMPSQPSILGQIIGLGKAGFDVSQQLQQAKAEKQQQALQAQDVQSQIASRTAATNLSQQELAQRQAEFGQQQKQERIQTIQQGFDPDKGTPFNYGMTDQQMTAGLNNPDPMKRAMFMNRLAIMAAQKGASVPAKEYGDRANQAFTEGLKAQDESMKYQHLSSQLLSEAATRAHLSAEDNARYQSLSIEASRLSYDVARGAQTAANAAAQLDLDRQKLGLSKQEFAATQAARKQTEAEKDPLYQTNAAVWKASAIAEKKAESTGGSQYSSFSDWLKDYPQPMPRGYGGGGGGGGRTVITKTLPGNRTFWRYSDSPADSAKSWNPGSGPGK